MKHIEEIYDEYNAKGSVPILTKSAIEKFIEWQKTQKKLKSTFNVISVQKIPKGLFVVYEK